MFGKKKRMREEQERREKYERKKRTKEFILGAAIDLLLNDGKELKKWGGEYSGGITEAEMDRIQKKVMEKYK